MKTLAIALYFAGALLLADTFGQWHTFGLFFGLEFMSGATALFFGATLQLISKGK